MPSTTPRWRLLLYPELKRFASARQADALKAAADTPFDAVEYVGLAIALAATVMLTRYSATDMGLANRFGAAIANFAVAIPMLLVLAGPFYVRRTRRGLRAQLRDSGQTTDGA